MTRGQSAIVRMLATRERADPAAQILLAHGVWMAPMTLPMEYKPMPLGLCFQNAQRLAKRRGLRYCEGMATARLCSGSLFPCEHGWCLDAEGQVIDPTWASVDHGQQPAAYLGIEIPLAEIPRKIPGYVSTVLFDYRGRQTTCRRLLAERSS
jgi:hypothetical protein